MSLTNSTVRPIDITSTMQEAYLDYAMSVIVARALPDVRDGLKPVHRRILYAMYHDLNLVSTRPHKKSARIVGEVLGKYHPHGDTAVYDAMVRMAQSFSLRYPLVDGQGNFGSIDGDNAAAMRYTEARLEEISDLMLTDLEKDTVGWHDNFDNSLQEPDILPAALPNLLINGASGIAVGMATNIPPHNLGEIVDALTYMIDRYDRLDEVTVENLLELVKGPDFPTGGILYRFREEKNEEDDVIARGYSVGKARLILQAKAHFEEMSRNRSRIVITELPYQTNKTTLIERIASLVRDGKIEGITDLRDESDRTGMRVVIELTRNVDPKAILAHLFKYTPLQQTFGMQTLALVDGQPRLLSLKRMLHLFIEHREEIIRRRSEYDLQRARDRAHILEGLLKALDILDEVIATIRKSQRVETARTNLMREFGFTQIQAQAILDMQLRRLAALERKRLQDEYKELLKFIAYLEDLLAHPEKILVLIKEDLLAIKEKYGDPRRTQIVDRTKGTLTSTDLLPEEEVWVSVSGKGEIRRSNVGKMTKSSAQSKAKIGQVALLQANTRDFLHVFASDGRSAQVAIHEVPREQRKHLSEFTDFSRRDDITAAFALPRAMNEHADGYLFFVSEQGAVKRVTMADFTAAAPHDPKVMNIDDNDRLAFAFMTTGEQEVMLVSEGGKSIRFIEGDVRSMGLAAGGVGGMKLKKGERIVYAGVVDANGELMTATVQGYVKRSALNDYSRQGRNGGGIVTHKLSSRTGKVTAATVLNTDELAEPTQWIAVVTDKGQAVMLAVGDVPQMGRSVQGKQLAQIGVGDQPCAVRAVIERVGDNGGPGDNNGDSESDSPSKNGKSAKTQNGKASATKAVAAAATAKTARTTRKKKATVDPKQASLGLAESEASKGPSEPKRAQRTAKASSSNSEKATSSQRATAKASPSSAKTTKRTAKKTPSSKASSTAAVKTAKKTTESTTKGKAKGKAKPRAARTSTAKKTSTSSAKAPKDETSRSVGSGGNAATKERTNSSKAKSVSKPKKPSPQTSSARKSRSTRSTTLKQEAGSSGGVRKQVDKEAKKQSSTTAKPKAKTSAAQKPRTSKPEQRKSRSSSGKRTDVKASTASTPTAKSKKTTTSTANKKTAKKNTAKSPAPQKTTLSKDTKSRTAQSKAVEPKPPPTKPTQSKSTKAKDTRSTTKPKTKTVAKPSKSKKAQKLQTVTTVNKKKSGSGKA